MRTEARMGHEKTSGRSKSRQRPEQGRYANFFQVGHNAAEFLIEFGQEDGSIHTRVYLSPQHARIFSDLLIETLRRHEKAFGPLVTRSISPDKPVQ
jgi:Protein of unknown function (DUF3467)